jgi:hypothetical protein
LTVNDGRNLLFTTEATSSRASGVTASCCYEGGGHDKTFHAGPHGPDVHKQVPILEAWQTGSHPDQDEEWTGLGPKTSGLVLSAEDFADAGVIKDSREGIGDDLADR